uniref:Glucuronosyltransferase n=1 Tax=Meloidogyne incognita TaxID=6306 RepID=A0A914L8B0_MELIC
MAQYLDILSKSDESKDMPIAVISPSISSLYRLIDLYCSIASKEILKEMPFICLKEFDAAGAYFSIKNQNVLQLVRMTSFPNFRRIYDEATLKIFEELKALRNRSRNQKNSSLNKQLKGLIDEEISKFIKKRRFVFLTCSFAMLNFLERIGVKFSGVIVDNAERLNEQENWHVILKTSPFVRLFGDYCQYSKRISNEQSKLDYNKSLLQRLYEDFGVDSNVNFHLNRQYTANPAIRAWGDSVFYKEGKTIPANKSVEKMNLNEILKPNIKKDSTIKLVTEPLVLVDISKLEGKWKESMFEPEYVASTNVLNNYEAYRNWGMALITAQHINLLIQNGIGPEEIACPLRSFYHHRILEEIFAILWPYNLYKFKRICSRVSGMLTGLHFSVYIRSFFYNEFAITENDYLKLITSWNFGLSKAKYQFMLISDSNNLKNNCIPKMKEMLECFQSTRGGIIVGPNDIFPLKNGQFEEIRNLAKKRLRELK